MTEQDVLKLRDLAEHTVVQLKERLTRDCKQDVAEEMVCMSNSRGGMIVIGINDKTGVVNPLSFVELQETNAMLSAIASDNVVPGISLVTENVEVRGGAVVVATVQRGQNIPYRDNKGVIWVKNAGDKKRVTDNAELAEMLMEGGHFHPDMKPVKGTCYADLDEDVVKRYLLKRFRDDFERKEFAQDELIGMSADELAGVIKNGQRAEDLLKGVGLIQEDGVLTMAALMLMGKLPQKWLPAFTVRCISFVGNSIGGTQFRDKSGSDADGNAVHLYEYIMMFLVRNLRHVQRSEEFNSLGELEISNTSLSELVVNAILHRSYVQETPLRVFVFDNRVEIHSPGLLPSEVTLESIRRGRSFPRNKFLFNHGINLLPYTGAGSGITRALEFEPDIELVNDEGLQEFVTIVRRRLVENDRVNDRDVRDNLLNDSGSDESGNVSDDRVNDRDDDRVADVIERVPYRELTSVQKNVIQYCSLPRSAREILEHIGYKYHPTHIATYIRPLLQMGYIEMLIPDKPNSRNQKYRKVEKR